jgi:hypothetical protein
MHFVNINTYVIQIMIINSYDSKLNDFQFILYLKEIYDNVIIYTCKLNCGQLIYLYDLEK